MWCNGIEGEEPFIFADSFFFSLHIFMHSLKVDSEFTSSPRSHICFFNIKNITSSHIFIDKKRKTYRFSLGFCLYV